MKKSVSASFGLILAVTAASATPVITSQPQNRTTTWGGEAVFSVMATGTGSLSYQWRRNSVPTGAISDVAVLNPVLIPDGGTYSVMVSDSGGSTLSANAVLTVNAPVGGDVDFSFARGSSIDGTVHALAVQPDGKVIIAGDFSMVHGAVRGRVARLNADGTVDHTFMNGLAGSSQAYGANVSVIYTVAVQADGKVLIGGLFDTINGVPRNNVARLNADGSLDNTFQTGVPGGNNSAVLAVASQPNGKVLIGGRFNSVGGVTRNYIARLNASGTLDTTFGSGLAGASDTVRCLCVQPDGKILMGGDFLVVNGVVQNSIARLETDGSLDTGFQNNFLTTVLSVGVQSDGKVLIGGYFTMINVNNGVPRGRIARLAADGTLDANYQNGMTGVNGVVVNGEYPGVYALAVQADDKAVLGGLFNSVNGVAQNGIARLNLDGSLDSGFQSGLSGADAAVRAVAAPTGGKVLLGGSFASVNGVNRRGCAQLNADGSVDGAFDNGLTGPSRSPLPYGVVTQVRALAVQPDGEVVVGGQFQFYNGAERNGIARLNGDGSLDTAFQNGMGGVGFTGYVYVMALQTDGKIVIAGNFLSVNGVARYSIARLNTDGSLDTGFQNGMMGVGPFATVNALAVQPDGKVVIGGGFGTVNGQACSSIARLNTDGSLDSGFQSGVNSTVESVLVQPDGKILIGGQFTTISGAGRNGLARLNADGSLDTGFQNALSGANDVSALAVQPDGKVLIGGSFTLANGFTLQNLARLNTDGSLDTAYQILLMSGPNGQVSEMALQPDGKLIIGGVFSAVSGAARSQIARLNGDGSLDNSFENGMAGISGESICCWEANALALQPDDKVLVGGYFSSVNGVVAGYLARLYETTPPCPAITCAPDKTVSCQDTWSFDPPTATDMCCGGSVSIIVTGTTTNATAPCSQVLTRTWQAADNCGRLATCSQSVTVTGAATPLFGCPSPFPNLVPNPDFETYSAYPSAASQLNRATGWFQPTLGTPDYFHALATSPLVQAPVNFVGQQTPHSGQAYAGGTMYTYSAYSPATCGREYLATPLSSPLVAGKTYEVSFYVSLAESSRYAIDNLGAYFSANPLVDNTTSGAFAITPHVRNPAGNYLSSVTNWMRIKGNYTASGGEQYLTIGNFYDDQSTPSVVVGGQNGFAIGSYYYVDDVVVSEPCDGCPADKTVECGSLWSFDAPMAWDPCTGAAVAAKVQSTVTSGGNPPTSTRTWLATGPCGQTATCSQTVTVTNTTPVAFVSAQMDCVARTLCLTFNKPVIGTTTPSGALDPGNYDIDSGAGPFVISAAFSYNQSMVCLTLDPGTPLATGSHTLDITLIQDFCGSNLHDLTVPFNALCSSNPCVTCSFDKTVTCESAWTFDPPTNTCYGNTITELGVSATGTCPRVARKAWSVTDVFGHTTTCTQTVTIVDATPPVITQCPTNQTIVAGAGCLAMIPDLRGQLVATDNCGPVTVAQVPISTPAGAGTWPIVYTVCDACTNCVLCTNFVTVTCTNAALSSLCGVKFDDVNGNGIRDNGEPGLPGWTIQAAGPINVSAVTDVQGQYCFTNLVPGIYQITEVLQPGWTQVSPAAGAYNVTILSGQAAAGSFDFGNCPNSPNWNWATITTGAHPDNCGAVASDAAGNAYAAGSVTANATLNGTPITCASGPTIFVVKFDHSGNLLWLRQAATTGYYASGSGVAVDGNGDVYVTGAFGGVATFGTTTLTAVVGNDEPDIFVAKYDAAGNLLWARSAGGINRDQGAGIAVAAGGGCYVTGLIGPGPDNFGSVTVTGGNLDDFFLAKYDSAGNALWARQGGGQLRDAGLSVAVDASDNAFVTGYFQDTATFSGHSLTAAGGFLDDDIFVAKYDSTGALQWLRQGGGSGDDFGWGIGVDGAGNCYVAGGFHATANFSGTLLTSLGGADMFLAKYNNAGALQWVRQAGGTGAGTGGNAQALAVDSAGNSYVSGVFSGTVAFGGSSLTSLGSLDLFVARYNASGFCDFATAAGGAASSDNPTGIALNPAGCVYLSGFLGGLGTVNFGSLTLNMAGNQEGLVASLCPACRPSGSGPCVVNCAADKTVPCGLAWNFDPPTVVTPPCGDNLVITELGTATNGAGCTQTMTRIWQVACCNDTTICTQRVTVVDLTPPVIYCAGNLTVECGTAWTLPAPTASDACCGTNVTITLLSVVTNGGACSKVITALWRATDGCSNSATCTQTVAVVDTTAPAFDFGTAPGPGPNLAPNPSFETYSPCPNNVAQLAYATPWFQPTAGPADLFNSCAGALNVSVPANLFGNEAAHSGQGYAGLCAYRDSATDHRAYLEAPLLAPLVAGKTYEVSFYVSLADNSGYAVDNLGAYLSIGPIANAFSQLALPFMPQVQSLSGNYLSSASGWVLIQGTFVATGGETHLTIGNFFDDQNTFPLSLGGNSDAYYYVDDVTVRDLESTCAPDKTVSCGELWTLDTPIVTDACCGTNVTLAITTVTNGGPCSRTITRTWQATDCCSNRATCSQTVTLPEACQPSVVSVAADCANGQVCITFSDPVDPGSATLTSNYLLDNGAMVNTAVVGPPNRVCLSTSPLTPGLLYNLTVSGVAGLCGAVMDPAQASFQCPCLTISCAPDKTVDCAAAWTFDPPSFQDICCGIDDLLTVVSTTTNGPCPRTATRTWRLTDGCGDIFHCSQNVTLADTTPPVITCGGVAGATGQGLTTFTFSGVVDVANPGMIPPPWNTAQVGDHWSLTYTFDPTAPDTHAPTDLGEYPTAVKSFTLTIGAGTTTQLASSAGVGTVLRVFSDRPVGFDQYEGAFYWPQNSLQFQLDDPTGSAWSTDALPACLDPAHFALGELWMGGGLYIIHCPIQSVTCAASVSVDCNSPWSFLPPTALDACCGTNVTIVEMSTTTNGVCPKVITRVWQATDCCTNTATCAQSVTVVDTTPPVFSFGASGGTTPPPILWQKSFGGGLEDDLYSQLATSDGGFLLGGQSSSSPSGTKTSATHGGFDYWIVKTDASGNQLWEQSFGGSTVDNLSDLAATSDGGYLLGGSSSSAVSGNKTSPLYGNLDYWIVKVDSAGNKLWDQSFGGSGFDVMEGILPTSDGGYLLSGYSGSGSSGNKTTPSFGGNDFCVVKVDASGNKLWEQAYGGSSSDTLFANVVATMDGGFLLGGSSLSPPSGNKTSPNYGSGDFWVVKIDASGNKLWDQSYGGAGAETLRRIVALSDGTFLLGGQSGSGISGNKTSPNFGGDDFWLVKIDASGNKLWDQSYGGNFGEALYGLAATSDGGFLLSGLSASGVSGNKTGASFGFTDYWLVKVDANGVKLWEESFGGSASEEAYAKIALTSDGGLLLGGPSPSGVSGNKTTASYGGNDFWVVRLGPSAAATCASNKTVVCGATWTFDEPTAYDACCGTNVTIAILSTETNGLCPQVITRVWQATDCCSNTATCTQMVTVVDTTPPVIAQCPANQTITAGAGCLATIPDLRGQLLATDNCGPVTVTQNPILTQVGAGVWPIVFLVCDGCTNCVTCTNFVTVTCGNDMFSSLCGVKFDDVNGNGIQDIGEPGLPGWTIQAAGPVNVSVVTDAQGHYCFTNLVPGNYTISEVQQTGWNQVSPVAGSYAVTISASQNAPGSFDFGNCPNSPNWNWATITTGTHPNYSGAVASDAAGNAYAIGAVTANATLNGAAITCSSGPTIFVVKFDSNGNLLWLRQATTTGTYGGGSGIAIGGNGDVFVTGVFDGTAMFGSTTLTAAAGNNEPDIFVAKYDSAGNLLWARSAGGVNFDQGWGIAAAAGGGCYVTGEMGSGPDTFGNITVTGGNQGDFFLAKYDSAGNVLWVGQGGGQLEDMGLAIAVDASDNACVTGCFRDTATFSGNSLTAAGGFLDADIFVAKYNSGGVLQWIRQAGGTSPDLGYGIGLDGGGNCYVVGGFQGPANFSGTSLVGYGGWDAFLAKYDASGTLQWVRQAGGVGTDNARHLAVDSGGNCYLSGSYSSTASFGNSSLTSSGSLDLFVARYNSAGACDFATSAGGVNSSEDAFGIALNPGGCLYVAGYVAGLGASYFGNLAPFFPSGNREALVASFCPPCPQTNGPPCILNCATNKTVPCGSGWDFDPPMVTSSACGNNATVTVLNTVTNGSNCALTITRTWQVVCCNSTMICTQLVTVADTTPPVFSFGSSGGTTPPPILWQKSFGGSLEDALYTQLPTSDGGFLLGGRSASSPSGTKTSANRGGWDYWVVKTDASGNQLWDRAFGGSGQDILYDLAATSDGGYLLGGDSASGVSGDKTSPQVGGGGNPDYWILKVDSVGNKVWDKTFGGNDSDYLRGVLRTSDGGFLLGGYSASGISGDRTSPHYGLNDLWLVKVDASGNKLWDQSYGGNNHDELRANVVATIDGGFLLGGTSQSPVSGNKTSPNYGANDFWVVKIDANGNKLWDQSYGGSGMEVLWRIVALSDGSFLLGGESASGISGNKTSPNYGGIDFWLVKIDANGNKLWDQSYGGSAGDSLSGLAPTGDGGFLLSGPSASGASGNKTGASFGGSDFWLVKVDAIGGKLWEESFGGSANEVPYTQITLTSDGGLLLGGPSLSGVSGNKTTPNFGGNDFWVVRLGPSSAPACASNKTVVCGATWAFDEPTAYDACCGTNVTIAILSTETNGLCPKLITRVWQATDCCSNSATCSQTVTVLITNPPIITCAGDKTVECGTPWTFDPPAGASVCCGSNLAFTVLSAATNSSNPCRRVLTQTWQVADCCTNVSTCTQTVTVVDTTPPIVTSTSDQTVECGSPWTLRTPTAADGCGGTNVTFALLNAVTNGLCPRIIQRVWQATDGCNNSATCTQTITVVDTTPPMVTCYGDKTVGACSITLTMCGVVDSVDDDPFDLFGQLPPPWNTVTEGDSWCLTYAFDPTAPDIYAPGNIGDYPAAVSTFTLTAGGATTTQTVGPAAAYLRVFSNYPPPYDQYEGYFYWQQGFTPMELLFQFDDASGNSWNSDALPRCLNLAGFSLADITISTSGAFGGIHGVTTSVHCATNPCPPWQFDPPSAVDACCGASNTVTVLSTVTNGPCPQAITRIWQIADCCTNIATCTQTVTLLDFTPPTIASVACTDDGFCMTFSELINPASVQPGFFEIFQFSSGSYHPSTPQTAVLQPDGKTICLSGFTPPLLPNAQWAYLHASRVTDLCGNPLAPVYFGFCCPQYSPPANDACIHCLPIALGGVNGCSYSTGGSTLCATPDGETTCPGGAPSPDVWYCLTTVCATTVVIDTCGSSFDTVISLHSGCPGTTANELACNDDASDTTCAPASRLTFNLQPGQTYYLRIAGKNGAAGIYQLHVTADFPPPILACANGRSVACNQHWSFDPPTVTASCCPGVTLTSSDVSIPNPSFPCSQFVTRTWVATDCCGHTGTCSQTMWVLHPAPIMTCPANLPPIGSCTAVVPLVNVTVSDGCTPPNAFTITQSPAPLTPVSPGTYTITVTATDACGVGTSCQTTLTVTPPVLTITSVGAQRIITWSGGGTLETANTLCSTCWTPLPTATSPYTVVPSGTAAQFFRVRCP